MFGNLHARQATIKYKITYNGFFVVTSGVNDEVAAHQIKEHVDRYGIDVQDTATIKPCCYGQSRNSKLMRWLRTISELYLM